MSKKHLLAKYGVENSNFRRCLKRSNEEANSSVVVSHNTAHMDDKTKVKEALKLFRDLYNRLLDEYDQEPKQEGQGKRKLDVDASNRLKKKGKWICPKNRFGHIPGVEIGDKFHFRVELAIVGLHCQYVSGIDYVVVDGKKIATSVVNSGRYDNKAKTKDVLVYSGEGGLMSRGVKADHKLKRGNLALVNSMDAKCPVRVIRKTARGHKDFGYTYEGLYIVSRYWQERDGDGRIVIKFELIRMLNQQKPRETTKKPGRKECCVVNDVSRGREVFGVRAMNGVDDEKPGKFAYITNTIYPKWCRKIEGGGCNCINGCSNSSKCGCVLKNGGEIRFDEKGVLRRPMGIVYECGPSCSCPPSCRNRVSQNGLRYQLELYKTETKGWRVRSRSYISSGSFVCELVGKLKQFKDIELNIDHQSHRFSSFVIRNDVNHDIGSFAKTHVDYRSDENEMRFVIDASKVGNVGRFIRYNVSPNLVVQRVLYDHDDKRMPHIMFFAIKNIPPLQELTFGYEFQSMDIYGFSYDKFVC